MLKLSNVTLARGSKRILDQASESIFSKEKVGLVGINGAGKSSLLQAILGQLLLDGGEISVPPGWNVATIAQEITETDLTVIEFALRGDTELMRVKNRIEQAQSTGQDQELGELYTQLEQIGGFQAEARMSSILHGLGFRQSDLSRKVGEFSGGWKMRINLARVLGSRADLVLLDEPTNHLDIDAVFWLEQWIKRSPSTVVLVSHDREVLDSVCTHTLHIHAQKFTKTVGGYSAFERAFAEKSAQIEQANQKSLQERQRLQQFVDRFKAKATKAKQAQSRVKRLEKIQLIESLTVDKAATLTFPTPDKSPDPLVVLRNVDCGYGPEAQILNHVTLEIRPGDRLGLLGANGNGKTTLIKTLVGNLSPMGGDRVAGKGLEVGYFAQNEIDSLDWNSNPLEHFVRLAPSEKEQNLRAFLARYHFTDAQLSQKVGTLSGGEKSRLALALLAYRKPNLLLLDEPTNHLDIVSRQSLVTSLLDYPGALVVVSHDRHLLESVTDHYLWVHAGQVQPFEGNIKDYAQALKQADSKEKSTTQPSASSARASSCSSKTHSTGKQPDWNRIKKLRNQVKKLEAALPAIVDQANRLDEQIAKIDYTTADASAQAQSMSQKRQELTNKIQAMEEELIQAMLELE